MAWNKEFLQVAGARAPSRCRHERVWLAGRAGGRDILIARTANEAGVALGRGLAETLRLPFETVERPY